MISNNADISLEMAVWLVHDDYDHITDENYISATALMKPIRHIILPGRVPAGQRIPLDVEDLIPSALGHALHGSIEHAWLGGRHRRALKILGYPDSLIDRVLVNPSPEELAKFTNPVPVYIEQRAIREVAVNGRTFRVGGKFDMVCDGRVTDTKSTSTYAWVKGSKDEDYQLQMSIYRWLNPDKITDDHGRINFIFTDWDKWDAAQKAEQGYPARRVMHRDISLLSVEETETWIHAKLSQVLMYQNTPEHLLPECTPKELWMGAPKFKYYANALNTQGRSTRNFESQVEADGFMREKGKGTVLTVPGKPKRCGYCPAFNGCSQKDKYSHD